MATIGTWFVCCSVFNAQLSVHGKVFRSVGWLAALDNRIVFERTRSNVLWPHFIWFHFIFYLFLRTVLKLLLLLLPSSLSPVGCFLTPTVCFTDAQWAQLCTLMREYCFEWVKINDDDDEDAPRAKPCRHIDNDIIHDLISSPWKLRKKRGHFLSLLFVRSRFVWTKAYQWQWMRYSQRNCTSMEMESSESVNAAQFDGHLLP